jgi:STE24 endopeptidase
MANVFFYIIIIILVLDYCLERLLSYLNSTYWSDQLPLELKGIYDQEKYSRSQQYEKSKQKFSFILSTLTMIGMLSMLIIGGFAWLDSIVRQYSENPIWIALFFFGILGLVSNLLTFPLDYYHVFVIEERFGYKEYCWG